MAEFNVNAPTNHNFNSLVDDKGVDSFFDTDHEIKQSASKNEKPQIPLTLPRAFRRAHRRLSVPPHYMEDVSKNQVKALPLNEKIFKEPVVSVIAPKPATKPYPFNSTKVNKKVEDSSYVVTTKEIVHLGIQLYPSKRCTKPKPFSFEERNKELLKKKEQKIKEYLEEEKRAREFHANPLPTFVNSKLKNDVSTILPTIPHPLKFKIEERIQQRHAKESNKHLEEDFKPLEAQPATVLYTKPFEPKKPERTITDVTNIELNTERRAQEHGVFYVTIAEVELIREHRKRKHDLELKKQEEMEIARLRHIKIHKANPVPSFKTPKIKKSTKPLTDPISPFLARKVKSDNTNN